MKNVLLNILRQEKRPVLSLKGYVSSAVLVPLFLKQGKYHLLFTQRSLEVKDHKGQISFPGGVKEKRDKSLLETALRESEEEIGLSSKDIEVLGQLGEIYTPTHYRITPYVGIIPYPFAFKLSHREIQGLIEVPISHLLKPKNLTFEHVEFFDSEFDNPYFRYQQHTIWGATGKITRELIELIKRHQR